MKQPPPEIKQGAPEWVVTFGDMMSLLLCFFVLILSFSTLELENFKKLAGILKEGFGIKTEISLAEIPLGSKTVGDNTSSKHGSASALIVLEAAREALEKSGMAKHGSVEKTERGVVLRLDGDALFPSGKASLSAEARAVLGEIAAMASERTGQIEVEGHTDNVPISSSLYPSNWELSTARAGSAARYLIGMGVPATGVKAVGYADTRPLVPNDTPENRAKNRRIEFLFVTPEPSGRRG